MKITIRHPQLGEFVLKMLSRNVSPELKERAIQDIKDIQKGEINSYSWEEDDKTTLFSGEFIRQSVVIVEG